jgi:hypothetical protein
MRLPDNRLGCVLPSLNHRAGSWAVGFPRTILAVLVLLLLAGCGPKDAPPEQRRVDRFVVIYSDAYLVVYKDTITGCEFISKVGVTTLTVIPGTCRQ